MEKTYGKLCPNCESGLKALRLDPKEPMCPYMYLYKKETCFAFKPIDGGEKN